VDLKDVLAGLGLAESEDALTPDWDASQAAIPSGSFFFLEPAYVTTACERTFLPGDVAKAVLAAAARIAAEPALSALAWHFHYCLFRTQGYPDASVGRWPHLKGPLGSEAGLFYVVVLLSGLPGMQAVYRARGIPAEIFRNTLEQMRSVITQEYPASHGHLGLSAANVRWQTNHFRGNLFTLGRLQFQFGTWGGYQKARVYRHRTARTVVALADGGVRFRADGDRAGAAAVEDGPGVWSSEFSVCGGEIRGHPIDPVGRALPTRIRLPIVEWQQVVGPREPVLNIHIPGGGAPLAHDRCGESTRAALEFFPRHFPDRPFVTICCGSWLLDGQIEDLLPATSNMVRFQREFYLIPIGLDGQGLLRSVFGDPPPQDLMALPRDTALRRAIADFVSAGKRLTPRAGGCFLLPEDLDWGAEVYRRQKMPWAS